MMSLRTVVIASIVIGGICAFVELLIKLGFIQ